MSSKGKTMTEVIHAKDLQAILNDLGLTVEQAIAEYGAPEAGFTVISEGESELYDFTMELGDNGIGVYAGSIIEWPSEDEDVPVDVAPNVQPQTNIDFVTAPEVLNGGSDADYAEWEAATADSLAIQMSMMVADEGLEAGTAIVM